MTIKQLNELFYLTRLVERDGARIDALRDAAVGLASPVLDGMPRGSGAKDRIGSIVPLIVDETAALEERIAQAEAMKKEILEYIDSVPFSRIKLILRLRYIDRMTWQEVADAIGGRETEYSVKQACYRYVEGGVCSGEEGPMEGQISWFDNEEGEAETTEK